MDPHTVAPAVNFVVSLFTFNEADNKEATGGSTVCVI